MVSPSDASMRVMMEKLVGQKINKVHFERKISLNFKADSQLMSNGRLTRRLHLLLTHLLHFYNKDREIAKRLRDQQRNR